MSDGLSRMRGPGPNARQHLRVLRRSMSELRKEGQEDQAVRWASLSRYVRTTRTRFSFLVRSGKMDFLRTSQGVHRLVSQPVLRRSVPSAVPSVTIHSPLFRHLQGQQDTDVQRQRSSNQSHRFLQFPTHGPGPTSQGLPVGVSGQGILSPLLHVSGQPELRGALSTRRDLRSQWHVGRGEERVLPVVREQSGPRRGI